MKASDKTSKMMLRLLVIFYKTAEWKLRDFAQKNIDVICSPLKII